jgi:hypothetical protein
VGLGFKKTEGGGGGGLIRRLVENTEGKDKKGKDKNDFAEDMINL